MIICCSSVGRKSIGVALESRVQAGDKRPICGGCLSGGDLSGDDLSGIGRWQRSVIGDVHHQQFLPAGEVPRGVLEPELRRSWSLDFPTQCGLEAEWLQAARVPDEDGVALGVGDLVHAQLCRQSIDGLGGELLQRLGHTYRHVSFL